VTQRGAVAGDQQRRGEGSAHGQRIMTHRVHAAVEETKATYLDPVLDCGALEPECDQLRAGDNSSLTGRQRRDRPVRGAIVALTAIIAVNVTTT
jgi:hypothetical protein